MNELKNFKVSDPQNFNLSLYPTKVDCPPKEELSTSTKKALKEISIIQQSLYAESSSAILMVFQGMDSSGKDGVIKTVTDSMDPQGVETHSFKQPSAEELRHDFIWRSAKVVPQRGIVGVFNRSYYENVLVARVHPELVLKERLSHIKSLDQINEAFWLSRYQDINCFESILKNNSTKIIKIFLHLCYAEQRRRLLERIDHKEKNWKFSSSDIYERQYWEQYQQAFEQMIRHTSTPKSPWWVIPADDKPYSRYLVANILLRSMRKIDPQIPQLSKIDIVKLEHYKAELLRES